MRSVLARHPVAGMVLLSYAVSWCLLGGPGGRRRRGALDVVRVECRSWHDGRLVLVGDAAHAMAPTLGQGANSALVDAAVLAVELAAEQPVATALERYGARRRPAVRRVQRRADSAARLASIRRGLPAGARDAALRTLNRWAGAAERAVRDMQQEDPASLADAVSALQKHQKPGQGTTCARAVRGLGRLGA